MSHYSGITLHYHYMNELLGYHNQPNLHPLGKPELFSSVVYLTLSSWSKLIKTRLDSMSISFGGWPRRKLEVEWSKLESLNRRYIRPLIRENSIVGPEKTGLKKYVLCASGTLLEVCDVWKILAGRKRCQNQVQTRFHTGMHLTWLIFYFSDFDFHDFISSPTVRIRRNWRRT